MYLPKEQIHYECWNELWEKGYRSKHFHAGFTPESFRLDKPLSERLIFTQSNARVLLGQDSTGRMAFICAPHEKDYTVPVCQRKPEIQITACPGMFYQTDVAMWLGKAGYTIEMEDGREFSAADEGCDSWYHDQFLPVTAMVRDELDIHVMTIAPVMEKNAWMPRGIEGTPLPGPSGAIYAVTLKNNGTKTAAGRCKLNFDRKFVIRSEYNGRDMFEEDCVDPYYCEWERDFYTMWRPDACVTLHMEGSVHNTDADEPEMYVPFRLAPGEEIVVQCRIAVAPEKAGIAGALTVLFQHDILGWINVTTDFWKDRLGKLTVKLDGDEELSEKYMDFQIRNIIDDFNCLQTDDEGRLLVHWQGAPSHNVGRFWGIDIEPTVNSVLYAIPEMGPAALEYLAERNEPRFSIYTDHSTPIRVALLIIAGKYLELTGNVEYFRNNRKLMEAIHATFARTMASRHEKHALFSSRYSSDGIVFHRYDVGTNAKVWLALRGYERLLCALGEACPVDLPALREQIRNDMLSELVEEGPFGPQFTGGKTYGEDKPFYFRDDIFYYDGEDSASCMMPVYGIFDFDEPAWKNYHRFARSLFCSNYDAEMRALRWFFYGAAVDGTAYISAMGGAVTRSEMRTALRNMIVCDLDLTGSLYWWPKGLNKRRCIARCSQGQGSWVIQGTEQWLGLKFNALKDELEFRPQGLAVAYRWEGARLGSYCFDVDWSESEEGTSLNIVNRNEKPIMVKAGIRPFACGCDGSLTWESFVVAPGESVKKYWAPVAAMPEEDCDIPAIEAERLAQNGAVFDAPGFMYPGAEQNVNAFLLRYVFIPAEDCTDVSINVTVPEGWGIESKTEWVWKNLVDVNELEAGIYRENVEGKTRCIAPFFIRMPEVAKHRGEVWSSTHPFNYPPLKDEEHALYIESAVCKEVAIRAKLKYRDASGEHSICRELPVKLVSAQEHEDAVARFMYGD